MVDAAGVAMALGSGIKPAKGDVWAQSLGAVLLPGERIHLLVKGNLGGMTDDLVAVTSIRLLAAQTVEHCRVRDQIPLADIQSVAPAGSRIGRHAVGLTLRDGSTRRLGLVAMRGAGEDEQLAGNTILELLHADVPAELRAASAEHRERQAADAARLAQAKEGLWPGTIVIGSRPRAKAAETVLGHCRPGETPWLIIASLAEGLLAAFDDRVIIVKTGVLTNLQAGSFGGGRTSTFPFDHITGIEYNAGMINGVLEILTPSYSGTANKDYWKGLGKSTNADTNNPHALSNTLPLDKRTHAQALPHLNELRARISQSKRITVTVEHAPAASPGGLAEQLGQIAALRDSGVLDESEFQAAKRKLLGA